MKEDDKSPDKIKELKKILQYLKVAISSDHITFRAMIAGDRFKKAVINPLEKISGWDQTDEENMQKLANEFKEKAQGKTLREKSDNLSKLLKIGGITATGLGIAGGITYLWKKNRSKKTEK